MNGGKHIPCYNRFKSYAKITKSRKNQFYFAIFKRFFVLLHR